MGRGRGLHLYENTTLIRSRSKILACAEKFSSTYIEITKSDTHLMKFQNPRTIGKAQNSQAEKGRPDASSLCIKKKDVQNSQAEKGSDTSILY